MGCETLPSYPVTFTAGDELPELFFTLEDVDLTAHLSIDLHVQRPDGTVLTIAHTPVDLSMGAFKFSLSPGDLLAGLGQVSEIQFVDAGSKPMTSPKFLINVDEEIA